MDNFQFITKSLDCSDVFREMKNQMFIITKKIDLQLAVIADEKILQERLSERDVLTRFEKENQSKRELDFMEKGVRELRKHNIDIMNIYNNDNLDENVEKVISYIADRWRKV